MLKAIEDHCINNNTVDAIGQFAIVWGLVEERYFNMCCNARKLYNTKVVYTNKELSLAADQLKHSLLEHYVTIEKIREHLNLRKNDKYFEQIMPFLSLDNAEEDEKIYSALCLCFRIRNNLFHGEKVFYLLNQQKTIIDSASAFLNELLIEETVFRVEKKREE